MEEEQQEVTQHEQADGGLSESVGESNAGITDDALGAQSETFFDPTEITDPGLQSQYKQMQAAFTRKMQAISQQENSARDKIEQYDAFMQDPVTTIQRLGAQYGLNVSRAQAQQMAEQQQADDPRNWNDVYSNAARTAEERIMEKIQPLLKDIQQTKKSQIESFLDSSAPDWREYENDMMAILSENPKLANDPMKLYRLAVPDDVFEKRAMQKALKKLKQTSQDNRLSGGTTHARAQGAPRSAKNFEEAVAIAKEQLVNKGS